MAETEWSDYTSRICAEIDLDAPVPCRFTETEEKEMLQAAEDIASAFLQHNWKF